MKLRSMTVLLLASLPVWADSWIVIPPENTATCAVPKNLIARTSESMPRTEFYSCMSPTIKKRLRPLDAVVEYGRKADGGAVVYSIAPTPEEAARLQKKYPAANFISRQDQSYKQYLAELNILLVERKKPAGLR